MFLKAENPSKEFQNSKSCSTRMNVLIDLSNVLPTFCKHVIIVTWTIQVEYLNLVPIYFLLDGLIAFVVTKLNVNASNCCK
jgi:hypothetical protein